MLDEIGEMKAVLQGKLLTSCRTASSAVSAKQQARLRRRAHRRPRRIAISKACSCARSFAKTLYYRLKVIEITVPPLRERQDEIQQLIEFFTVKYAKRYNRPDPAPRARSPW